MKVGGSLVSECSLLSVLRVWASSRVSGQGLKLKKLIHVWSQICD